MLYIGIVVILVSIGIIIYSNCKYNKDKKEIYNEILKERKEAINKTLDEHFQTKKEYYDLEEGKLKQQREELIKEVNKQLQFNAEVIASKEKQIDYTLEQYKKAKQDEIDRFCQDYAASEKEKIENSLNELRENYEKDKNRFEQDIVEVLEKLNEYRDKQVAVNEAIIREKEIQEKENFYKIVVTENDIQDMKILKEIEHKLCNKEIVNKLIYETYIRRPAQEMVKRVLNGDSPSGIYKITFIQTGESYIGKATSVAKRWGEHIKTSYGLGTIAHSSLHTKMAKEGVWNFTFELLEAVPKEQLTEREKYYIKFYDTKNYGLNQREG